MPIDNQIEIPQSFMAMYVKPGHSKPSASHDVILGRYLPYWVNVQVG